MNHILIIEDEPAIVIGLEALLKSDNYNVSVCTDGKDGFNKALKEIPDAILLDVSLPSINGLDICRLLREKKFPNPIIILTSRSELSDKIVGLEIGADDYITKPFNSREVLARLRAQLRRVKRIDENKIEKQSTEKYRRKLLSIMFTDIQDYSKIMNKDENLAMNLLEIHNNILTGCIKKADGKIIEIIGDAFLVSFESAVDAVNCAVSIQKKLKDYNKAKPHSENIKVRIGIHLGDVIKYEGKLKGDVLNIAARIQQNAEAGYIYISEAVNNAVKNKTNLNIKSLGKFPVKNIEEPLQLFSISI